MVEQGPGRGSPDPAASFDPRYVVERELGRGAMGRVFLARDQRLDRLVAIKALAPGNHDARELLRLEHEARAAGSLNHPNIVAVHDIGVSPSGPFIVSEYVPGVTLRQRLDQGALPLREAMAVAAQLAQGLAAAHERGIVHRDLKPENLLLGDDGWLKILDFGIAKRIAPPSVAPTPSAGTPRTRAAGLDGPVSPAPPASQTSAGPLGGARATGWGAQAQPVSPLLTSPGMIMGTVGYMSPEQVRGKPADARSDIFSCGLILYEMIAGSRAFLGPTAAATSYAILRAEPRELPASVPAALRETLGRCLRKDPAERWQTAAELSARLEELRAADERQAPVPALGRRGWTAALIVVFALAAVVAIGLKGPEGGPPPSFQQLTFQAGAVWSARFGAGGTKVFYGAAPGWKPPRIFTTEVGNPESARLEIPPAALLAVSPAGDLAVLLHPRFQRFGFRDGTLAIVSPSGAIEELAPGVDSADFAPDGTLALVRQEGRESRLESPPGHRLAGSAGFISSPRFSPDGELIAYVDHRALDDSGTVAVVDLGGHARDVTPKLGSVFGLAWSPAGDEIWFSAGGSQEPGSARSGEIQTSLRAASLGGKQRVLLTLAGEAWIQDVARDGRVLVTQPLRRLDVGLVRDGHPAQEVSWLDPSLLTDLSHDGSEVLLTVGGGAANDRNKLYLRKADGSPGLLLGEAAGGSFSSDGTLAAAVPATGATGLLFFPLPGPGEVRRVETGNVVASRAVLFPDGGRVLVAGHAPGRGEQLFVRDLPGPDGAGAGLGEMLAISPEGISGSASAVAPDGAWVAAVDATDQTRLYPVGGGAPRGLPGARPHEQPFGWDDDGFLYVGILQELPIHIDRIDVRRGRRAPWKELAPEIPGALGISRVRVARDGKSLAFNHSTFTTHLFLLTGLR